LEVKIGDGGDLEEELGSEGLTDKERMVDGRGDGHWEGDGLGEIQKSLVK
jgi:hypothetical protein